MQRPTSAAFPGRPGKAATVRKEREAGTTYVASYYAPNGHYAATPGFFATAFSAGVLSAPASGNGRYLYSAGGGFPTSSWNSTNYFVDVVFRSAQA